MPMRNAGVGRGRIPAVETAESVMRRRYRRNDSNEEERNL